MKATGSVRPVDPLGRVVIPKEMRKSYNLEVNDSVEIFVGDNEEIILKKYEPACMFCDSKYDIINYHNKMICKKCLAEINKLADYE